MPERPMLEQPDAANLLDTARDVLLRTLLPALPEALRFQARMVANAMAVARREGEADPAPALAALRAALGAPEGEAGDLLMRLARDIRAGAHDPGTPGHAAVAEALLALTRLRCGVSAPKALGH
ncbi:DUF6285 domain-containing protein [Roseicella frigidaeris]|uniref:DUF6285 domain-containing protein n=1 Tax=Roseicella frigidaeris TaxID=2230885 RepID=A0A327M612_9PROT|nr:DUF6285 domain-containing protein [Roseicella frigidaeris]RAI58169.1 hypothetical protein DOO78_15680 [Roseicella frigidaeris]